MNSTPNVKPAEADDVLVARADERLAHAYEQIARADEQLARVTEKLSRMEQDAIHAPAVPHRKPPHGGAALRGLIGLLLAACIAVAAFASRSSYGDAAKLVIARWAPQLVSTLSLPPEKSGLPAQPGSAAVQLTAVETVPQQATNSSPATTQPATAQDVAPTAAPTSPELAQLLQTMIRVLASVEQGVQELKAGQEKMASDNAKVVEQLRASQEQMTRLLARTSEPNPGPKTAAPLPRPITSPARKPVTTHSLPQARAQPQTSVPLEPEEQ